MKLDCLTLIVPVEFFKRMEEVVENKAPIKRCWTLCCWR